LTKEFRLREFMIEYGEDRIAILDAVHCKLRNCCRVDENWKGEVVSFLRFNP
jgi:hypothetical protein